MHPTTLPIGSPAPDFKLPATDGNSYALSDFDAPVFVYIQGCNHCPTVHAYLKRIIRLAEDYRERGVQFVMVNSNDAERYPHDSFAGMVEFARQHRLPFPYLHDADQTVASAYRTSRTPEILVFDRQRKLVYHGRIDDNPQEASKVTSPDLREALDALLAGRAVARAETPAVGCTVKWKPGNEPVAA